MRKLILAALICSFIISVDAQITIDGSFAFQTDSAKKYSLYIPSNYDETTPHSLMLALHPFNVNRWDAESWRDTLIQFAETNDLLLVCPDGGIDGQVDSPIDTAFTTVLLDSVNQWYNINNEEQYIMGFSWGGRTTYTYGLRRAEKFRGFMVIGAAANISHLNGISANANNKSFYLIHGSQDNPSTAFTPLLNELNIQGACTNSLLMSGINHTIDFPERNEILSVAFQWLKDSNCSTSSAETEPNEKTIILFPNPNPGIFQFNSISELEEIRIYSLDGRSVEYKQEHLKIDLNPIDEGIYLVSFLLNGKRKLKKINISK